MQKIREFELVDHGIVHSRYFQGCGMAFTSFKYQLCGIGDNPSEAVNDCLEQMAQAGFETEGMEARIMEQEGLKTLPVTPSITEESWDIETYYHVSIRWN